MRVFVSFMLCCCISMIPACYRRDSSAVKIDDAAESDSTDQKSSLAWPHGAEFESELRALSDRDPKVREMAINTLVEKGPRAVATLKAALKVRNEIKGEYNRLHRSAAKALGRMGDVGLPTLLEVLQDSDHDPAYWVAHFGIPEIGRPAVPSLVKIIDNPRHQGSLVQARAFQALTKIGGQASAAVPSLIKHLKHGQPSVRRHAIIAIAHVGPGAKAAIPALIAALDEPELAGWACHALGSVGPDNVEGVEQLLRIARDSKDPRQNAAILALGGVRIRQQQAVELLVRLVQSKPTEWESTVVRRRAATALGKIRPVLPETVPALAAVLKEEDSRLVQIALQGLLGMGGLATGAIPALIAVVKSGHPDRIYAIRALGEIGPDAVIAVPTLTLAATDASAEIRNEATQALRKVRHPK
jgi:HEAT repeat protein